MAVAVCSSGRTPSQLLRRQKLDQLLDESAARNESLIVALKEGSLMRARAQSIAVRSVWRQIDLVLEECLRQERDG